MAVAMGKGWKPAEDTEDEGVGGEARAGAMFWVLAVDDVEVDGDGAGKCGTSAR
jgi:hypothetical protein